MPLRYMLFLLFLCCTTGSQAGNARMLVVVHPDTYDFPNAFSPDGDGNNDVFRLLPGSSATLVSLQIYNRLGEMVFDNQRDGKTEWDGRYMNHEQPMGTYVFYARVQLPGGTEVISDTRELLLTR